MRRQIVLDRPLLTSYENQKHRIYFRFFIISDHRQIRKRKSVPVMSLANYLFVWRKILHMTSYFKPLVKNYFSYESDDNLRQKYNSMYLRKLCYVVRSPIQTYFSKYFLNMYLMLIFKRNNDYPPQR